MENRSKSFSTCIKIREKQKKPQSYIYLRFNLLQELTDCHNLFQQFLHKLISWQPSRESGEKVIHPVKRKERKRSGNIKDDISKYFIHIIYDKPRISDLPEFTFH